VESLENTLDIFRINTRPGIAHCHQDACVVLLGADQQLSWPLLNRPHCFDRIQNQVQDDLLQLNTIRLNGKRPLRKVGIYQDSILGDCGSRQYNYFIDRLGEQNFITANIDSRCVISALFREHGHHSYQTTRVGRMASCPCRKSNPQVLMVQSTKHTPHFDEPGALNVPPNGRILAQR
jgi:hypothetical protein